MPYVKVYIHFVWSTKNRVPFLNTPELRKEIWIHIRENARKKGIFIDSINGYHNHCHCLISLGVAQNIEKIIQMIKGESSYWANHHPDGIFLKQKFAWQEEYFAVSVSESVLDRVRNYILTQEDHHRTKTYEEEYLELLRVHGFKKKN